MTDDNDLCSWNGALQLSEQITSYWKNRGRYGIRTEIIEFKIPRRAIHKNGETSTGFTVKSNIGPDGYPPRLPELTHENSQAN